MFPKQQNVCNGVLCNSKQQLELDGLPTTREELELMKQQLEMQYNQDRSRLRRAYEARRSQIFDALNNKLFYGSVLNHTSLLVFFFFLRNYPGARKCKSAECPGVRWTVGNTYA